MYYVFPCGMFDTPDYVGPYTVMFHRNTPSTPQGDRVSDFLTKQAALAEAEKLNANDTSLEDAIKLLSKEL